MLRQSIARFERLLSETDDPELAEAYRAEIAAAKAMLEEIERGSSPAEKPHDAATPRR